MKEDQLGLGLGILEISQRIWGILGSWSGGERKKTADLVGYIGEIS